MCLGKGRWSRYISAIPAPGIDLNKHVIQAFPPWLDLPPRYIVNDWIAWRKGKLVAARLRQHPEDIQRGVDWLKAHVQKLTHHDCEWLKILQTQSVDDIASLLEAPTPESQELRSGMPFKGEPFVTPTQMEAILERAYVG